MIWDRLELVRIYTKPKGQLPDYNEPVVIRKGHTTIENFCNKARGCPMRAPPRFFVLAALLSDRKRTRQGPGAVARR